MTRCSATTLKGRRCKKTGTKDGLCSVHCVKEMVECGICYDENSKTSKDNLKLDCEHIFCKNCVFQWIIEHDKNSCPFCRQEISKDNQLLARQWGIANDHLFYSTVYYYYFDTLPEIDSLLLAAQFNIKENITLFTDTHIEKLITSIQDNINFKEMFDQLKQSVSFTLKLVKTKYYPDKPKRLHMFVL